jgi:twitching motility protein PilT
MSLVPSLLQAIITTDGEALVLHVGEKPYVVTPTDQVDLATRGLTFEAVNGIVNQLLPAESQRALDEFGAVQFALPPLPEFPGEHFTIVAARGGEDLWAEIRRRRVADKARVPAEGVGPTAAPAVEEAAAAKAEAEPAPLDAPDARQLHTEPPEPAAAPRAEAPAAPQVDHPVVARSRGEPLPAEPAAPTPGAAEAPRPAVAAPQAAARPGAASPPPLAAAPHPEPPPARPALPAPRSAPAPPPAAEGVPRPAAPNVHHARPAAPQAPPTTVAGRGGREAVPQPQAGAPARPAPGAPASAATHSGQPPQSAAQPAVVLPLARNPIRPDVPPPLAADALAGLDRLLRLASARGASTLYLSSNSRPSLRVDGDIHIIDGAPILGPNDVEALLLTLMPERNAEALRTGVASEWICEVPDVGRVRCLSFRDHRGPGGVFRMMPVRTVTAEQLGLSREVQALAIEPEGLVLVAGPRSSGKRTLMAALVDLINRTRRDHVITIEREIDVAHDRTGSFISQREVRGGTDEMLAVARAALREDPDVLVLEEVRTPGLMNLALDAAASGQLVLGGFPAHDATGAIDRIIDLYPPEYRRQVQLSLAQNLRGVVAQVLLRRTTGGRVAAREVLLNTPAVRSLLTEGKTSQLPLAIEGSRLYGMVPLNDALVGFVQSGVVDLREAYWRAGDRAGFLALLKRQGLDTSLIERPA